MGYFTDLEGVSGKVPSIDAVVPTASIQNITLWRGGRDTHTHTHTHTTSAVKGGAGRDGVET